MNSVIHPLSYALNVGNILKVRSKCSENNEKKNIIKGKRMKIIFEVHNILSSNQRMVTVSSSYVTRKSQERQYYSLSGNALSKYHSSLE